MAPTSTRSGEKKEYAKSTVDTQAILDRLDEVKTDLRQEIQENRGEINKFAEQINQVRNSVSRLGKETRTIQTQLEKAKADITTLQSEARKKNLITSGLAEHDNENTQAVVKKFFEQSLEIKPRFDEVFRLGKLNEKFPRPIKVTFIYNQEKKDVLHSSHKLKGSEIYINEDLSKTERIEKAQLRKIAKKARGEGKEVRWTKNGLKIDSRDFIIRDGQLIPALQDE